MYPSSLSRRAISSLTREVGIWAVSCSALLSLRIRASMSAIGSVSIASPGTLGHARDHARVGEIAQADPAQPELPVDGTRSAAPVAPVVAPRPEALRTPGLGDQGLLGH